MKLGHELPRAFVGGSAAIAALVAAVWIGAAVVPANLRRTCVVDDTPYLDFCDQRPAPSSPGYLDWLKSELDLNPGDAGSLVKLVYFSAAAERSALLRLAVGFAPNDPNVLAMRADAHLARQEWPQAVPLPM